MKNIPIQTDSIREVSVEIKAGDLRLEADGYDVLILRVTGLSSESGRPISRSLRIPTALLETNEWS